MAIQQVSAILGVDANQGVTLVCVTITQCTKSTAWLCGCLAWWRFYGASVAPLPLSLLPFPPAQKSLP